MRDEIVSNGIFENLIFVLHAEDLGGTHRWEMFFNPFFIKKM